MNVDRLKQAEEAFLKRYPGGFEHPAMLEIGKKHKMDKMIARAHEVFSREKLDVPELVIEPMVKLISASSLVSVFEKPRFRDATKEMSPKEQVTLVRGLDLWLNGKGQKGFELMLDVLSNWKLAKWSLMTVCPAYYHPNEEVFLKPTTVKGVIETFQLEDVIYKPRPSWDFYERYRAHILEMRSLIDSNLKPNNAAFCGFLMMSIDAPKGRI